MGAHASVTKRKVICKKFLLLCVDFPAQDRSPIKGAVISPFYIESSTVDIVSLLRKKVYMVARNNAEKMKFVTEWEGSQCPRCGKGCGIAWRRCWKSPKTRFARGTHALVTKREVISKKFLLLCVDFLARKCYHTNSSMFCVKLRKQSIFVGILCDTRKSA